MGAARDASRLWLHPSSGFGRSPHLPTRVSTRGSGALGSEIGLDRPPTQRARCAAARLCRCIAGLAIREPCHCSLATQSSRAPTDLAIEADDCLGDPEQTEARPLQVRFGQKRLGERPGHFTTGTPVKSPRQAVLRRAALTLVSSGSWQDCGTLRPAGDPIRNGATMVTIDRQPRFGCWYRVIVDTFCEQWLC